MTCFSVQVINDFIWQCKRSYLLKKHTVAVPMYIYIYILKPNKVSTNIPFRHIISLLIKSQTFPIFQLFIKKPVSVPSRYLYLFLSPFLRLSSFLFFFCSWWVSLIVTIYYCINKLLDVHNRHTYTCNL